jgi:hypothetical protein
VAVANAAADRIGLHGHSVWVVLDLDGQVEVLEDAVEQGQRALQLDLHVEQRTEREEKPALEGRESDDVADGWCAWIAADLEVAGQPIDQRPA